MRFIGAAGKYEKVRQITTLKRVLVIGGYGNFGRFISTRLAPLEDITLIVAGRSQSKAYSLASELGAEAALIDINQNIDVVLSALSPDVVIHTSGPFQAQAYDVARAAIRCGAHYIDLADGRQFVDNISSLNEEATAANVLVVSGASSLPCLSAAVIDKYHAEFNSLESIQYGITTAQQTTRGLATIAAILSYTGKAFTSLLDGRFQNKFGWQGLRARKFTALGWRLLSDCDVPDLALFPKRYPSLRTIRFSAGLELSFLHLTLWLISWFVRAGVIRNLESLAPTMLKLSNAFNRFGGDDSGFYMMLSGPDDNNKQRQILFELIARRGDGPNIPCVPAILLTEKIIRGEIAEVGAKPCVGLIELQEYLNALEGLDISWHDEVALR